MLIKSWLHNSWPRYSFFNYLFSLFWDQKYKEHFPECSLAFRAEPNEWCHFNDIWCAEILVKVKMMQGLFPYEREIYNFSRNHQSACRKKNILTKSWQFRPKIQLPDNFSFWHWKIMMKWWKYSFEHVIIIPTFKFGFSSA